MQNEMRRRIKEDESFFRDLDLNFDFEKSNKFEVKREK